MGFAKLNLHRRDLAVAHRGSGFVCYSVRIWNIKVRVGPFTRFRCRILVTSRSPASRVAG